MLTERRVIFLCPSVRSHLADQGSNLPIQVHYVRVGRSATSPQSHGIYAWRRMRDVGQMALRHLYLQTPSNMAARSAVPPMHIYKVIAPALREFRVGSSISRSRRDCASRPRLAAVQPQNKHTACTVGSRSPLAWLSRLVAASTCPCLVLEEAARNEPPCAPYFVCQGKGEDERRGTRIPVSLVAHATRVVRS